eukprot:1462334-Prymnesium_polylepis.2
MEQEAMLEDASDKDFTDAPPEEAPRAFGIIPRVLDSDQLINSANSQLPQTRRELRPRNSTVSSSRTL